MKKTILLSVFLVVVMHVLPAQEMQVSGGLEFGFGAFKIDNNFWFDSGVVSRSLYDEKISTALFAPGLSFSVRTFEKVINNTFSSGFVFRDRAIFVTNYTQSGTVSVGSTSYSMTPEKISETYSIGDDDFFISMMDFDMGTSTRCRLSEKLHFYTDLGINVSIASFEDYDTDRTLSYWGAGIFSNMALQVNLQKTMYLEFGLNAMMSIISSQEGTVTIGNKKVEYEDSGRWDLPFVAAYIHIGWRYDVKKLRKEALEQMMKELAD
jgi:hypothetical protein